MWNKLILNLIYDFDFKNLVQLKKLTPIFKEVLLEDNTVKEHDILQGKLLWKEKAVDVEKFYIISLKILKGGPGMVA